jgi:hypothetical protein
MLGVVSIATAWSGYQAARWSRKLAAHSSKANALRVASIRDSTLACQSMFYDVHRFKQWLNADFHGETSLRPKQPKPSTRDRQIIRKATTIYSIGLSCRSPVPRCSLRALRLG